MKHAYFLGLAGLLTAGAAQAQITITQSNFPATAATVERMQDANPTGLTAPTAGANQTWNYSAATFTGNVQQETYIAPPANAAFPTATRAYTYQVDFGPVAVNGVQYQSLNANGLQDLGFALPEQRISLRALTFGPNDSLIIPAQARPYTNTYLVKFPLTTGTVQVNSYRSVATGVVTVALAGLTRTRMRIVQRVIQRDSVAGWGTLRVPAVPTGGTAAIPVLLRRTRFVQIDSLYEGSAPASPTVLALLNIQQGQVTRGYSDQFFRENSAQPLVFFFYTNSTYQTVDFAQFSRETNLVTSSRAGLAAQVGGVVAYPNPVAGQPLTIALGNGQRRAVQLTVRDLSGRSIRTAPATTGQPSEVLSGLAAGTYVVDVVAADGARSALKVAVQ
ncbi:T9SS type A sorting domain-containing protein [Hymenobacter gummosus]|uniref:T9SS type A sorting domain-containing protein n=1 Tax=Hymenobacter gummosus TaxID=1776032 RepID=A0A3S0J746_9BACT|nr:T9SS type A sorting domain-containing protein [Hymenobacter gummosus]RTQ46535.1 T9SS type A sorting domain-containing protein [Hymenobacter gummosus]